MANRGPTPQRTEQLIRPSGVPSSAVVRSIPRLHARAVLVAPALVAAALFLIAAPATRAVAQVTSDDAKCRSTIDKTGGKYAQTGNKNVVACINAHAKGKPGPASCANPLDTDGKGKLGKARVKLTDKVGGPKDGCAKASAAALLPFQAGGCPLPGTIGAVAAFADVGACTVELMSNDIDGDGMIASMWRSVLDPDTAAIAADADLGKCAKDLAKQVAKLHATASKQRGKCQQTLDKAGGAYDYACGDTDDGDKIAAAEQKLRDAFTKRCAPLSDAQRKLLGSCDVTVGMADCIVDTVLGNAGGLTATGFEYAGVCPTEIDLQIRATGVVEGDTATRTRFAAGYSGILHDVAIPEGPQLALDVSCPDGTCGDCSLSLSCRDGRCRCDGDFTTLCDEPFGPDADDCAGGECIQFLEPPRPATASGSPVCLVGPVAAPVTGTTSPAAGAYSIVTDISIGTYIGGTVGVPCPTCDVGPSPALGDIGVCGGPSGTDPGSPCTVDAVSPTFGATSYDCQPLAGSKLADIPLARTFSTEPKTLGTDALCGSGERDCHCGVCDDDPTLPCSNDQECVDAGAVGPCDTQISSIPTLPNLCDNLVCNAGGQCDEGTFTFCDGFTDEPGHGVIACMTNADCELLDASCPGGDCGACALVEPRPCYPDSISVPGQAAQDNPLVSNLSCVATSTVAIDIVTGFPGPTSSVWDTRALAFCADGVTRWGVGGSGCP